MCTAVSESDPVMLQDYISVTQSHPWRRFATRVTAIASACASVPISGHMERFSPVWTNGVALDGSDFASYRSMLKEKGITVGGERSSCYYMDWDGCTTYNEAQPVGVRREHRHVGMRHGHPNLTANGRMPQPAVSWFVFDAKSRRGAYGCGSGASGRRIRLSAPTTIEGLAQAMEVPVDELVNGGSLEPVLCCGRGRVFPSSGLTLTPIETAPFYAVKCEPEILNTDGGPRRSAKERSDVDGNPIPNLYSAGEFGSIWSNYYQGGGNLGECCALRFTAVRTTFLRSNLRAQGDSRSFAEAETLRPPNPRSREGFLLWARKCHFDPEMAGQY